ncbi:MAG: DM13 domain-containing protein [Thainema sp.]
MTSCNRPLVNSADFDGTTVSASNEREVIEPIGIRSGTFTEGTQPIQGTAQILEEEGAFYLEFDPTFRASSQEAGQVLLTPEAVPPSSYTDAPVESYLDLGPLSASQGEQRYLIPPGTDINGIQSVVILGRDTAISMGYASFEPNTGTVIESVEPVEPVEIATADVVESATRTTETAIAPVIIEPAASAEPTETAQAPEPTEPAELAVPTVPTEPTETAQAIDETAEETEDTGETAQVAEPPAEAPVAPRALW